LLAALQRHKVSFKPCSERLTQLNSTQLNRMSFSCDPVFIWLHDVRFQNVDAPMPLAEFKGPPCGKEGRKGGQLKL